MSKKQIMVVIVLIAFLSSQSVMAINDEEQEFGNYLDKAMLSSGLIVLDVDLNRRIAEIGNRIVKVSDAPSDMKFTFRVINDPTINAYSAASGYVYINTGLLDILESEEELAGVLAHEIAHINEHHQMKLVYKAHRKKVAITTGLIILAIGAAAGGGFAIAAAPVATSAYGVSYSASSLVFNQLSTTMLQLSVELTGLALNSMNTSLVTGYSKKFETEADTKAVKYLFDTQYDPADSMVGLFKKLMTKRDEMKITEKNYMSHLINQKPGLEERLKLVESLIEENEKSK